MRKTKTGRPPGESPQAGQLGIRVTERERAHLTKRGKALGLPPGGYVRKLIRDDMERP